MATTIVLDDSKSSISLGHSSADMSKIKEFVRNHTFRNWYGAVNSEFRHHVKVLTAGQLSDLLTEFFQNLEVKDPLALLDALAECIPNAILVQALQRTYPGLNPVQAMTDMLSAAKFYLEATKKSSKPHFTAYLSHFFDGCVTIFESILGAFGIADFFKPTDADFQSDFKLQRIMTQIMLMTMLLSMLIPIIGPLEASKIVGGAFGSLWVISVLYPCIPKRPTQLPKFENWTKKVAFKELPCPQGRKVVLDRIASQMVQALKEKQHVMLIGPSGVGKTETLKALSHAIYRGDYPELSHLKIFYANTANLAGHKEIFGGGNKIITHIKNAGNLKGTVQIFDEIHTACKESGAFGDQLKTELDENGCFHTVIGVTTAREFAQYFTLQNPALARRFKVVEIEPMSEAETISILNTHILKEAPDALVDEVLNLSDLVRQTGTVQPLASLNILRDCLKETRSKPKVDGTLQQEQRKIQVLSERSLGAVTPSLSRHVSSDVQQELRPLPDTTKLFRARENIVKLRKQLFVYVASLEKRATTDQQTNKFLLMSHCFKLQTAALQQKAKENELTLIIDGPLVDKVVDREQQNQQRLAQVVAQERSTIRDSQAVLTGREEHKQS